MSDSTSGELVRRFFDEFMNARQLEIAEAIFAADITYCSPRGAGIGLPGAKRFYQGLFDAFDPLHFEVSAVTSTPDMGMVRVYFRGLHVGKYGSIPATGRHVSFPMMFYFEFQHHQISRIEGFFDAQLITSQIGRGQPTAMR